MRMINHPTFGLIAEFNEAEMNHGPDERACKGCHLIFNVREVLGVAPEVGKTYKCRQCDPPKKTALQAIEAVIAKTREASAAPTNEEFTRLWEERKALYEEYLTISNAERAEYEASR